MQGREGRALRNDARSTNRSRSRSAHKTLQMAGFHREALGNPDKASTKKCMDGKTRSDLQSLKKFKNGIAARWQAKRLLWLYRWEAVSTWTRVAGKERSRKTQERFFRR